MHSFKSLGLLETTTCLTLPNWSSLVRLSMELRLSMSVKDDATSVRSAAKDLIDPSQMEPLLRALDWLFSPASLPPLPTKPAVPIDLFSALLAHKLRYNSQERDMVILHHEIIAEPIRNYAAQEEVHTSSLTAYGTAAGSAMSRCVGLPVAFAALRVLDGGVNVRGVMGPTDESIYTTVLSGLEEVGLGMKETMHNGVGVERTLMTGLSAH